MISGRTGWKSPVGVKYRAAYAAKKSLCWKMSSISDQDSTEPLVDSYTFVVGLGGESKCGTIIGNPSHEGSDEE